MAWHQQATSYLSEQMQSDITVLLALHDLTHGGRVTHICVIKLTHHCVR